MTEKRFVYKVFDIVDFKPEEFKLYEIDNNPSDDLDESNLFYVYSTSKANIEHLVERLNELADENEQLKKELKRCREWINSDKYDYETTLAFIKSKGYSLKDVLEYKGDV